MSDENGCLIFGGYPFGVLKGTPTWGLPLTNRHAKKKNHALPLPVVLHVLTPLTSPRPPRRFASDTWLVQASSQQEMTRAKVRMTGTSALQQPCATPSANISWPLGAPPCPEASKNKGRSWIGGKMVWMDLDWMRLDWMRLE